MEGKTSFEKLLNSSQNIVPKRLSFDFLEKISSTDGGGNQTKKRKIESPPAEATHNSVSNTFNESSISNNDSLNNSGFSNWEKKILRIDLVDAQTRVRDPAINILYLFY